MSDVKLIVMYPRPKDIEAFEKLYQDEHVPMAVEKLSGKTKFVATKVVATPGWDTPAVLPYRRGLFSVARGLAGVCTVRRRPGDGRPCRQNLQWRPPGVSGCRRADVYFWWQFRVGTPENAGIPLKYGSPHAGPTQDRHPSESWGPVRHRRYGFQLSLE